MTRDEKIAEAKRLRAEGLAYREIAEQLHVNKSTAWAYLNPERAHEHARRRDERDPEWRQRSAEQHRQPCIRCGTPCCAGSRWSPGRSGKRLLGQRLCSSCELEHRAELHRERDEQIVKWWAEGLTYREMAARLDWSMNHIRVEIVHLRERGCDLPYRRAVYPNGKPKHPELVA